MNKFLIFALNLAVKSHREQVLERAAGLTFRVLLAFFPFLIFLMSLIGFLELDETAILEGLYTVLPSGDISMLVERFLNELSITRSAGVLSTALFFSVYNTTNGFRAIIRSINHAYGIRDERGIVRQVMLSLVLMLLFSAALIIMISLLVFGRQILGYFFPNGTDLLYSVLSGAGAVLLLIFVTSLIYKLANAQRLCFKYVLPGGVLTVIAWVVVSTAFGFVTQNFTQYPAIYGSIAGVFILILWLNTVSVILLIGNEINATLFFRKSTLYHP